MPKTIKILILDESEQDAKNMMTELRNSAIPVLIQQASTREGFEKACAEFRPDLILSDYTLVGYDGFSAMELTRQKYPEVPFIFVSWVIHEESVIETLKKGATDYVFKDQLSRLPLSVHRAIRESEERAQLRETQKKIIEQERLGAIGQMASGIAHDFSNSLMPVLGFSEILLNNPAALNDREKTGKYLNLIHTSATDAMNIVGRLREFYRSKDKAEALHAVNLNAIVRDTVLMTQPRWRDEMLAKGADILVREELSEIPDIHGNETALREAMTNLIFNAVDAMPKGGELVFRTTLEKQQVALTVSDTGMGMTEEVARRCLEPFFSTKGRGGTGLGLAMVYGVVKRHEGAIEIKSELGKGTTFKLLFPVKRSDMTTDPKRPDAAPAAYAALPKLHVLVVDDEKTVHEVLKEYLRLDGHTVETAENGRTGLELFKKGRFDLVVTDRAMPEMNGDEMVEQIKLVSPSVPVIMVTGFGELMKVKGEHPKGVDIVLSKPLTLSVFREAAAKVFSGVSKAPHS